MATVGLRVHTRTANCLHIADEEETGGVMMTRSEVIISWALGVAGIVGATAAHAVVVPVSVTQLAGTVAQGTSIFRADLSGIGLSEIQSIRLVDSNSGVGGSSGASSGSDLDGIELSNTLAASATAASAAAGLSVFDFSPSGAFFTPGAQRPPTAPKLFGTDASGLNVAPASATLGAFDASFFLSGGVSLGDGGQIAFNLTSPVSVAGLYLYVGENGSDPGESISGSLFVSSDPVSVPEPAAIALVGVALGLMPVVRRRGRVPT